MPVKISGSIKGKKVSTTIKDGATKPFFLGEKKDPNYMVIIGSGDGSQANPAGLHLIVQASLGVHRDGRPMGAREVGIQNLIPNTERVLPAKTIVRIMNLYERENVIEASYMPARSKK